MDHETWENLVENSRTNDIIQHEHYMLASLLWQPLITKINDHTSGKSLSGISSGEFTRELDKESLLNLSPIYTKSSWSMLLIINPALIVVDTSP